MTFELDSLPPTETHGLLSHSLASLAEKNGLLSISLASLTERNGLLSISSSWTQSQACALAAAIGGPVSCAAFTPLRNGISLAASDPAPTARELYRQVMSGGVRSAFRGATAPAAAAIPAFACIGPLYHRFSASDLFGPNGACCAAALVESLVTYGAHARSVQLARNAAAERRGSAVVAPQRAWDPRGAGFAAHALRNAVCIGGLRIFAEPVRAAVDAAAAALGFAPLAPPAAGFAADLLGGLLAALASMPIHLTFVHLACAPRDAPMPPRAQLIAAGKFLRDQYLVIDKTTGAARLGRAVARDAFMRCAYIAPCLATYSAIERACVVYLCDPDLLRSVST